MGEADVLRTGRTGATGVRLEPSAEVERNGSPCTMRDEAASKRAMDRLIIAAMLEREGLRGRGGR